MINEPGRNPCSSASMHQSSVLGKLHERRVGVSKGVVQGGDNLFIALHGPSPFLWFGMAVLATPQVNRSRHDEFRCFRQHRPVAQRAS